MLTKQPRVLLRFASLLPWTLLVGNAGAEEQKPLPTCLAGVCVGQKAPTENALKKRFGGQSFALGYRTRGYCYRFAAPDQPVFVLFGLTKHYGDWRVGIIRVANRPICAKPTVLSQRIDLATGEGARLGLSVEGLRAIYGEPKHMLDSRSKVIAHLMGGNVHGVDAALQYVPGDVTVALSAIFVVADDRLVAIEITSEP